MQRVCLLKLNTVPGRQLGGWNVSGACYCGGAGTPGFGQTSVRLQGCCEWSSSPDESAPDCEADSWGRCSGCCLTSPSTPGYSAGCQEGRKSPLFLDSLFALFQVAAFTLHPCENIHCMSCIRDLDVGICPPESLVVHALVAEEVVLQVQFPEIKQVVKSPCWYFLQLVAL